MRRSQTKMMMLAAAVVAAAAIVAGVVAAEQMLTDGRSPSLAVTIRGTNASSAYRAAFRIQGKRVCMKLTATQGHAGDEASSDSCVKVQAVPVGLEHAMCMSHNVFVYGAAPRAGRLSVSRGGTLQTRRLGSVQAYVVALSSQQLPARFGYAVAGGGRQSWSIAVPAVATACGAQSGIEHPTDTVGYLE